MAAGAPSALPSNGAPVSPANAVAARSSGGSAGSARREPPASQDTNPVAPATAAPAGTPPPAAPSAPPIAAARGAAASGEGYRTWLQTTGGYSAGQTGSVGVELAVSPPFHANPQYPYKFTMDTAPDGVLYPGAVVRGMHVDGRTGSLAVPFTASRAGSFPIAGTLSFSICADDRCLIDKAHVAVVAEVR